MKILIVEDEQLAAKKLGKILRQLDASVKIVAVVGTIQSTVQWLLENPPPDVIFMDIELADGQSFEIYNRVNISSPVIFTTSYDEYALKAFKVSGIDYLLKPVQKTELQESLKKICYPGKKSVAEAQAASVMLLIDELSQKLKAREFRKRFLAKNDGKLMAFDIEKIAYFFYDGPLTYFNTYAGETFIMGYTMEELENMLDPVKYFRVNRSLYISFPCLTHINDYAGHRLLLDIAPPYHKKVIVSRERVADFKKWAGK